MLFYVQQLIKVQRQTRGRRRNGLVRELERARRMPECAALVGHIQAAIELHAHAGRLALDWRRAQKNGAQHLPGAGEADRLVDLSVSGLHHLLVTIAETWPTEPAALAKAILDHVFPNGAVDYTNLPYSDEHDEVNTLLAVLGEERYAEARSKLNLDPLIERLAELNRAYGALLVKPERLSYEHVKEADDLAYEAYVEVIGRTLGLFPTNEPEDLAKRSALLEPLFDQLEDLRESRAAGRSGGDEDEEDEDDDEEEGESEAPPEVRTED